ncbi:hypothetical protein PIB30_027751 [Stylosanthes scabra]|uniref:Uncharacterized protein n=1 Tax=Stylosanthes scabra TaxID=79078 RepID=A0ABU6Y9F5_9FABA|nr:hypothetical protein [Stylosanthes scabra]
MPDPSAGHELMRRLTARNPTLSDTLLTGYGFPIVSVRAALSMWLRHHQSVTYALSMWLEKPPVRDICAQKENSHNSPWGFPEITSVGKSRIQSSVHALHK